MDLIPLRRLPELTRTGQDLLFPSFPSLLYILTVHTHTPVTTLVDIVKYIYNPHRHSISTKDYGLSRITNHESLCDRATRVRLKTLSRGFSVPDLLL